MDVGAVGYLRNISNAIGVARAVMEHTAHTLLAGEGASDFAVMMGFQKNTLSTPHSEQMFEQWEQGNCQPNYFRNVLHQNSSCPPYKPLAPPPEPPVARQQGAYGPEEILAHSLQRTNADIDYNNHDTIAQIVIDQASNMACGTSTNGANHKVAGRIGDSPIAGAGAYCEQGVGGAGATGDGDTMSRFLPTFRAVQNMAAGMSPTEACEEPIRLIAKHYPTYQGALVCIDADGNPGAAAYGWTLVYSYVSDATSGNVTTVKVPPVTL